MREIALQLLAAITLLLLAFCAQSQEPGKPASGPLAEFNMAIATVMKTPVILNSKGKKIETFCKKPDPLNEAELKKLQLSCEKIFTDPALPEIQRVAAKYILGKTKTQYGSSGRTARYCDEALRLLSPVADFYDQRSIAGNGPHEAMASCLVLTKRHEAALAWTGRGIKRKETSQIYYLAGISWKNLQEPERAHRALKKSVALDATNEPAKKMLAEVELLLSQSNQDDTPEPEPEPESEPLLSTETDECQQWKASIIANRAVCDQLLRKSYEDFFSCMDNGMTNSGYGPRSDEQTQMLYETCGVSSWTDESLSP
jgi:tetratricopeptide (TPR) repeat protein